MRQCAREDGKNSEIIDFLNGKIRGGTMANAEEDPDARWNPMRGGEQKDSRQSSYHALNYYLN